METVILGIISDKGGVGKTTTSIQLANYMSKKSSLLYIDTDYKQQALNMRNNNINDGMTDFNYEILYVNTKMAAEELNKYYGDYEYIIIDLPGNQLQPGVIECYSLLDIIFVPMNTSNIELNETINFMEDYKKEYLPEFKEQETYMFFNRIKTSSNSNKDVRDEETRLGMPFPVLKSVLADLITFQNNLDTLKPLPQAYALCSEMQVILKEKFNKINNKL